MINKNVHYNTTNSKNQKPKWSILRHYYRKEWGHYRVECGITLKLSMEIIYHKKNSDMLDPPQKKDRKL